VPPILNESIGGDAYESAKFSNKACELMTRDRVSKRNLYFDRLHGPQRSVTV
jgi:hypothetical protein